MSANISQGNSSSATKAPPQGARSRPGLTSSAIASRNGWPALEAEGESEGGFQGLHQTRRDSESKVLLSKVICKWGDLTVVPVAALEYPLGRSYFSEGRSTNHGDFRNGRGRPSRGQAGPHWLWRSVGTFATDQVV